MGAYVDGVLVPPADAGSLDGIPADLQPAGAGQDGYVVTYVDQDGALELKPASGGGMTNPMTAAGDLIAGSAPIVGGLATPARLAAGSAGYILRIVSGTPAWRELFAPGLSGARPQAAAAREGQWYWSTNAAAGLELAVCTHQGSGVYAWVTVPYGATATGVALVQAANAAAALGVLPLPPFVLPLTGYATSTGPLTAVAWITFDPALYAISGKTASLTLETTGSVSAGGLTGTVTLQNLTASSLAATIPITATTPTTQTASVPLPTVATVYELRLSLTGTGYVALGALLRITWS